MKEIAIIGASGFVGKAITEEALNKGHKVTAIVRNAGKISIKNPRLKVIEADVSSQETVAGICKGFDTVISAYSPGWTNPNIYEETLKIYPTILRGVKEAGVKRLLIVGGAGTLFVAPGLRVIDSGAIPESIMPGVKSLGEFYLNILMKEKEIDWVFFSPARTIAPGKRTGKFRLGKDDLIIDAEGNSNISVEDYAVAMLDEAETPLHHQERFTIGY
ncbi:putative NADH-flavin reductase [Parabacteroides sp. PF5-5]|uniref:NAD(P)-dependent oxidoreductase n=1 Tax=unclassified Parabacteroides TaxID=2649774 RepID=UPI002474FCA3|nr:MULTISPECIES: NAD(P)-dependent oxidoreductase [unclassified Parabacteroides]MDH6303923.1 putative NADH-flavin reductase [Parabacteroides sp. PH5-39]MDH6314540.1 putative NADH-flavin reductase [Parabacteroides sp. PF5-13]MDH6318395.1 putative NADH-flavin reductase [Parabacteroides sp. PH5-13]MDH6322312.1 putative NADH-flavin reductase [Parabacteroides sp. PH5-8]MDH6325608.1 putative NADH-flavin reductase [Parabacteroides sp. PH5-41]